MTKCKPEPLPQSIKPIPCSLVSIDPKPSKKKADPAFKGAMELYYKAVESYTGLPPKIGAKDGAALKSILAYLRKVSKDQTDDGVLTSWSVILNNYSKWEAWHQKNIGNLCIISTHIQAIIQTIKASAPDQALEPSRKKHLSVEEQKKLDEQRELEMRARADKGEEL